MKQCSGEAAQLRWGRLAEDFARLACVSVLERVPSLRERERERESESGAIKSTFIIRDVGELLLRGHDDGLAEAERYIVLGHTIRTGHVVEYDDIDDVESLTHWVGELDLASVQGWAPPVPEGFWASFLRWRTPLGMARLTDRRIRVGRIGPLPQS